MLSQCSSRSSGSSCHSCRPERWPARAWPRHRSGPCVSKGCCGSPGQPAAAIDLAVALAEEGAKQAMLHGEEPYVLVQGQFDPPRRAAGYQIEQLLEGQFMAGGNPLQVQCSSARQMHWPADPGGGSVLGARRQGLGQKRLQGLPICWHQPASPSPAFRGGYCQHQPGSGHDPFQAPYPGAKLRSGG